MRLCGYAVTQFSSFALQTGFFGHLIKDGARKQNLTLFV